MISRNCIRPRRHLILANVSELDEMWSTMLDDALRAARAAGRHDVADYLDLKARNDVIRQANVRWLFEAVAFIALEAEHDVRGLTVEREQPHSFGHRGANLTGELIRISQGVRCLTIEAGWTRTPSDGFMRGGALAMARLSHRGMPKKSADLILKPDKNGPGWTAIYHDGATIAVDETFLRQHFAVFIGE